MDLKGLTFQRLMTEHGNLLPAKAVRVDGSVFCFAELKVKDPATRTRSFTLALEAGQTHIYTRARSKLLCAGLMTEPSVRTSAY